MNADKLLDTLIDIFERESRAYVDPFDHETWAVESRIQILCQTIYDELRELLESTANHPPK